MNRTKRVVLAFVSTIGLLAPVGPALAQSGGDALEQGFKTPPDSAKPRAGWHWTSGDVTNQWTNRQIGDRLAGPDKKVLTPAAGGFGGMGGFGGANQAPLASGLLGPVAITSIAHP
jgi:hypothetical protein